MSRGFMGVVSVIALLILAGLILTHASATQTVGKTLFSGVDTIINDLSLHPRNTMLA